MNNGECKDLWRLMSEYKFVCPVVNVNKSLSCILCHSLMIDACQSVCGCRFCHRCIEMYLVNGKRYCPGGKGECIEEYMVMERDVSRIPRINDKIAKLPVICPNGLCLSTVELRLMEDHLRLCKKQLVRCPYVAIGCLYGEHSRDVTVTHITDAALSHTELLIQWIKEIKDCVEKNTSEISSTKKKSIMTNRISKEILSQFSKQMKDFQSVKDNSAAKDNQLKEVNVQISALKRELEYLKKDSLDKKSRIESLEGEVRRMNNGGQTRQRGAKERRIESETVVEKEMKKSSNIETEILGWKNEIIVKSESQIVHYGDERMNNWISLCFDKDIDYVWKINDLSTKKDTMKKNRIFSESFYSNKYKFCLCLYIDNDDRISLCCYLMRGDHDEHLQWPMRRVVTFNIIDQFTLAAHKTGTCTYDTYGYECAFDRPMKDMNDYGIGIWPFIDYAAIIGIASVIVNDSMVVTCVLK